MASTDSTMALANITSTKLRDMKITVAVDTSGSTSGQVLKTEIDAIMSIFSMTDSKVQDTTCVLPWNLTTYSVISLPSGQVALNYLVSKMGTTPSCLYTNPAYLKALKKSGIWFLFTDGLIDPPEVQRFCQRTTQSGLHGYSNVTVVFGSSSSGPPAKVNFSVGITTFAFAPDCLVLFHDIFSGTVHILQAKGCFKCLLQSEAHQPILDDQMTWSMLPQIRYQDLANVNIPNPKVLTDDQVAFQNGLVIRLKDLFEGTLDERLRDNLNSNPENMRSISMQSFSRGKSREYENWVDSMHQPIAPPPAQRPDLDGRAGELIKHLLDLVNNGTDEATLNVNRRLLRAAHEDNRAAFQESLRQHERKTRQKIYSNDMVRRTKSHMKSMTEPENGSDPWSVGVAMGGNEFTPESDNSTTNSTPESSTITSGSSSGQSESPVAHECFLPGFKRALPSSAMIPSEYIGACMLCQKTKSVLVFLMSTPAAMTKILEEQPDSHISDVGFDKVSILDILSPSLCCDSCAFYIAAPGANLLPQPVTGAIALVSCGNNRKAWYEQFTKVFPGSPQPLDITLACWSAAFDTDLNIKAIAALQDGLTYKNALLWLKEDLKRAVEVDKDTRLSVQPI